MKDLPKDYNGIVYQIIRPTGLLDPVVEIRPALAESFLKLKKEMERCQYQDMAAYNALEWENPQIPDLILEINKTIQKNQRVLVTTLTKKMAEELSEFLLAKGIKSKYLHSDIDTVERVEILRDLRKGLYSVLVGINLLREGLDLPEVSLIAILDADKEGFLRSKTSLIQVIGRAARHVEGKVIMYADKITDSMQFAINETRRRRKIQNDYNILHNITPQTIKKAITDQLDKFKEQSKSEKPENENLFKKAESFKAFTPKEKKKLIKELEFAMQLQADMMEFENAAQIRDLIKDLTS